MKSPRQALQSRISKRRDIISQLESARATLKENIRLYALLISMDSTIKQYRQVKANLKVLREDQKLDKILYVMLLREEANLRFYSMIAQD